MAPLGDGAVVGGPADVAGAVLGVDGDAVGRAVGDGGDAEGPGLRVIGELRHRPVPGDGDLGLGQDAVRGVLHRRGEPPGLCDAPQSDDRGRVVHHAHEGRRDLVEIHRPGPGRLGIRHGNAAEAVIRDRRRPGAEAEAQKGDAALLGDDEADLLPAGEVQLAELRLLVPLAVAVVEEGQGIPGLVAPDPEVQLVVDPVHGDAGPQPPLGGIAQLLREGVVRLARAPAHADAVRRRGATEAQAAAAAGVEAGIRGLKALHGLESQGGDGDGNGDRLPAAGNGQSGAAGGQGHHAAVLPLGRAAGDGPGKGGVVRLEL